MAPRPRRSAIPLPRSGGFTLLELVIALTLFGIISVVLFSALRLGGRLWERVD
jgi:general secretion pathway protein J